MIPEGRRVWARRLAVAPCRPCASSFKRLEAIVVGQPPRTSSESSCIWPPEALLGEEILEATVDLLISLVNDAVESADGISVTLLSNEPGAYHTPSATSEEMREADAVQYETGQGPCVQASRTGEPVNVVIASERRRWPEFSREAARRGMQSVLSVPLFSGEQPIGALNVYSQRTEAFADHDQRVVVHFGRHAGVALTRASEFMATDWVDEQLEQALSRADVVGQAKGILMAKGYSPEEALASLRRAADRSNRKLSEVAQDMVTSNWRVRPS